MRKQLGPLDRYFVLFLLGAALCWPTQVRALGSRIPNQDPVAIARGNAFAATADNPAAIYYNPAGITQLDGHNVQLGSLLYMNIYADYKSPSGQRVQNEHELIPVPELHYVFTPKGQPFSFGLGVYSPFGLGMEWPAGAPFRNAGLEARLAYVTINPVVAWKPFQSLSIAIGPTFNYSEAKLRQGVAVAPFEFAFKGHDWDYGLSAGLLWQPHPKWSFGAKYTSATTIDYSGTGTFSPAAPFLPPPMHTTGRLEFPQIIAGGIAFTPPPIGTSRWTSIGVIGV